MINKAKLRRFAYWLVCVCMLHCLNACIYSSKTQHRLFNEIENKQFDIIIVPGVPFENNLWDRTMKGRVYWAKYLFDKGITKNIIFSGAAVYSPYYEGKIMELYAAALGIPKENIYTETKAEHTTENVYYSYKLAKKLGFKSIAFVSDPFQTKMMKRYIRKKIDPTVPVIPFVVDTLKIIETTMIDPVIDYHQAFKKDFISLKKRENVWKRWRGTRGKNIDKKADAQYWVNDFLQVQPCADSYNNTDKYLQLCKNFITKEYAEKFDIDKSAQLDMLNRSIDYFKTKEEFSLKEFNDEVIHHPEVVDSFMQYKQNFEKARNYEIEDEFDIHLSAVKKQAKVFKSVLKLDKNFHIYIHGRRDLIEKCIDETTGKKYYKIYFEEEW